MYISLFQLGVSLLFFIKKRI
ncbi:sortase B protein-sorting domain-containing protein [Bacillus pseudomycoides]